MEKEKVQSLKGEMNALKPTTSTAGTSTGPAMNTRAKAKDQLMVTIYILQDLRDELQTMEQETIDSDHDSEVTKGSDLEEEDSKGDIKEMEEQ